MPDRYNTLSARRGHRNNNVNRSRVSLRCTFCNSHFLIGYLHSFVHASWQEAQLSHSEHAMFRITRMCVTPTAARLIAGFIAGQLNSTRRRVELRRGSVHSGADATRRRVVEAYTVHQRSTIISERRDPVESICTARRKLWRKLWLHHSFTFLVQQFALLRGLRML